MALSSATAVGCAPDSEPDDGVVETAHLRITNTTGNPICAGTSILLESELERIATALEQPLWPEDDKLEVRLGQDAVTEVCSGLFGEEIDQAGGCAVDFEGEPAVAALELAYVAPHELVHAVRRYNRTWTALLFEEGLAELLSGSEGFPVYVRYPHGDPTLDPLELLEIPRAEFSNHYVVSMSFVSWLWETHGRSP